jgi:hypothetical protein
MGGKGQSFWGYGKSRVTSDGPKHSYRTLRKSDVTVNFLLCRGREVDFSHINSYLSLIFINTLIQYTLGDSNLYTSKINKMLHTFLGGHLRVSP